MYCVAACCQQQNMIASREQPFELRTCAKMKLSDPLSAPIGLHFAEHYPSGRPSARVRDGQCIVAKHQGVIEYTDEVGIVAFVEGHIVDVCARNRLALGQYFTVCRVYFLQPR